MASSSEVFTAVRAAAVNLAGDTNWVGARAVYVGVAGDVKVDLAEGGSGITFKAHPVGYLLAQVTKIYSSGTTATDLLVLY